MKSTTTTTTTTIKPKPRTQPKTSSTSSAVHTPQPWFQARQSLQRQTSSNWVELTWGLLHTFALPLELSPCASFGPQRWESPDPSDLEASHHVLACDPSNMAPSPTPTWLGPKTEQTQVVPTMACGRILASVQTSVTTHGELGRLSCYICLTQNRRPRRPLRSTIHRCRSEGCSSYLYTVKPTGVSRQHMCDKLLGLRTHSDWTPPSG
ncbi:hypothetical protein QBC45DRAFT_183832 [Copromyces sp. CBS 386.78]|nr:hypothetical protein QBC45DRAFT_183832 [Copromyces sp. CBS 386.78]